MRQQELLQRAFRDTTTALPNRAAMEAQLETLLDVSVSLSCLFLEVDGLVAAHGLLGRAGGEALLHSAVARMQDCVHHDDTLGRFGSDKFLVLVHRPHTRPQLSALAASIVQAMGAGAHR